MPDTSTIALSAPIKAAVATVDITDLVSLEFRGKHRGAGPDRHDSRAAC